MRRLAQMRSTRCCSWLGMQIGSHQVARGVVVLAFVVLGVRLLQFIDHYAVNILFWDQWDFLTGFFEGRGWWDLFTWQHSTHHQGLGNLSIYALHSLSGWDVRVEALAAGVIVYAASLVALLVKRQLFHTLVWTDVCIPLVFLTLAQYEIFIGTPNLAHGSLPLLLVMLFCLAMLNTRPLMRVLLCLIINFVAIYTGFALFLGLVTIVFLALLLVHSVRAHQEVLLHAVALVVALASFASFFLCYTFVQPDLDCFLLPDYISFLAFIVGRPFGITRFVGIKVWLSLGILALLVVTSLIVFWRMLCASHPSRLVQVIFVLTTFSLLFSAHTAAGRLCLGVGTAGSSRYVPYKLPAIFGLYLGLLRLAHFRPRAAQVLVALFVMLCVIKEVPARQDNATIHWLANGKQAWKNCYLQSEDIAACDKSTGFPIYPIPQATRLSEKLQYLKDHRLNLYKDALAP